MNRFDLCDATALQPFVRCLVNRGVNYKRYFERQRLLPEQINSGKGKVIKRQVLRFFEDVTAREGLRTFGFLDNDPYSIDDLGTISFALLKAVTLKDAIDTFCNLVTSFAEGNYIWLVQEKDISWLCCYDKNQDRSISAADQHTILILREVIRLAVGKQWQPKKVLFFATKPKLLEGIPELEDVECIYSQDYAAVGFETAYLSKPLKPGQQKVPTCQESFINPAAETTSDAITSILESIVPYRKIPSVSEITEMLGTSRMTLYRSLKEENASYRQIVDRVRFNTAKKLLLDTSLTNKEISYELGFTNPNNFYRSFRRISGLSPGHFRSTTLNES